MSATMAARARTGASLSAPVRRAQPARRKSSPWLASLLRGASRRPGRALVFLAFGLVSLAIVVNALMFQKARHPHPMLSRSGATEEARPAAALRRAEPAPAPAPMTAPVAPPPADIPALLAPALPPSRPTGLSQVQPAQREAAPRPPAAVTTVARTPAPAAAAPRAAAPAPRDPIADLINGGDFRPPAEIRGASARSAAAPRRTAAN
ncbi:hypothetical protein BMIN10S_03318 [Bosea minatitlanensis]